MSFRMGAHACCCYIVQCSYSQNSHGARVGRESSCSGSCEFVSAFNTTDSANIPELHALPGSTFSVKCY